jgi:hypothetical protein
MDYFKEPERLKDKHLIAGVTGNQWIAKMDWILIETVTIQVKLIR